MCLLRNGSPLLLLLPPVRVDDGERHEGGVGGDGGGEAEECEGGRGRDQGGKGVEQVARMAAQGATTVG